MMPGLRPTRDADDDDYLRWPARPDPTALNPRPLGSTPLPTGPTPSSPAQHTTATNVPAQNSAAADGPARTGPWTGRLVPTDTAELLIRQGLTDSAEQLARQSHANAPEPLFRPDADEIPAAGDVPSPHPADPPGWAAVPGSAADPGPAALSGAAAHTGRQSNADLPRPRTPADNLVPRRGDHPDHREPDPSRPPLTAPRPGARGASGTGLGDPRLGGLGLGNPGLVLAEQLKLAWVAAGRPSMSDVGDEVGYSKATISKVLSGKMAPAWQLVRKLGVTLGVSRDVVQNTWHPLWIAADTRRRHVSAPVLRAAERACARCGCVIAEPRDHDAWHSGLDALLQRQRPADTHEWVNLRDAVRRREE